MNRAERVYQYMKDFGSITPMDAFIDLGYTRLACAINEMKRTIRPEDGQGNAGEPATCTEIKNIGARCGMEAKGDAQRMQHMVLVKMLDVFA